MTNAQKRVLFQYRIFNMENTAMEWDEEKFLKTYKGTEKFVTDEGLEYYLRFLELLKNEELLLHIKFANDILGEPPLKTFILHEREYLKKGVFDKKMTPVQKRGIGACFGYLFKFIYGGYESEQRWFNDEKTGIKTASCFIKKERQDDI